MPNELPPDPYLGAVAIFGDALAATLSDYNSVSYVSPKTLLGRLETLVKQRSVGEAVDEVELADFLLDRVRRQYETYSEVPYDFSLYT